MPTTVIAIVARADVERARRTARLLALSIGFDRHDAEQVALTVSELDTNLLKYAQEGRIGITALAGTRPGVQVESHDAGPGIADLAEALVDGFSTGGGLGGGLSGVRRLMDDVEIDSSPNGTHIIARKWIPNAS